MSSFKSKANIMIIKDGNKFQKTMKHSSSFDMSNLNFGGIVPPSSKGKPKVTKPELQAKHWFNEVIMTTLLNYNKFRDKPNLKLAIGLPKFETYEKLVKNIEDYFSDNKIDFRVYFVNENSKIEEQNLKKIKKTSP